MIIGSDRHLYNVTCLQKHGPKVTSSLRLVTPPPTTLPTLTHIIEDDARIAVTQLANLSA